MKLLTRTESASSSTLLFVQFILQSFSNSFKAFAAFLSHTLIRNTQTICFFFLLQWFAACANVCIVLNYFTHMIHTLSSRRILSDALTHFYLAKQNEKLVEHFSYSCSFLEEYFYRTTCV